MHRRDHLHRHRAGARDARLRRLVDRHRNVLQSAAILIILVREAGFASWAKPYPLRWSRIRDMLRFGVPLGVQNVAHNASRYWDNLAISHFFGPGATGAYNLAYNLADIPAIQVGEQIALVLMPSMAALPPERRRRARSSARPRCCRW